SDDAERYQEETEQCCAFHLMASVPLGKLRRRNCAAHRLYWRLATCPNSVMSNRTTKRKKSTLATPAAATAIPEKPSTAAISATMKKMRAQRSMANPP